MNRYDALERELTTWLSDTATPRMPDFRNDLLQQTVQMRQRSRWSFPERWLPMSVVTLGRRTIRPVPWQTVGLLALLILLLAVAIVAIGTSRPRPAPMLGVAANGLVAYGSGGDIFTVDPASGTRKAVIVGPEQDRAPHFSLDGTRLIFLRTGPDGDIPVVADADGRHVFITDTTGIADANPESITWSPDGRSVALRAGSDSAARIYVVDAIAGTVTALPLEYLDGETYWRPPDGRALMFVTGSEFRQRLMLYSLDTGALEKLASPAMAYGIIRPSGWTADGHAFAYYEADERTSGTHLVQVATGDSAVLEVGYGELSNDGTRLVGLVGDDRENTWLCVEPARGGSCTPITEPFAGPWGWDYWWSPDDRSILTRRSDGVMLVLDPAGGEQVQPDWMADGGESWQRQAP
jgi:dipeptidyl aminopeptidase/acylaminoacyl peptidase